MVDGDFNFSYFRFFDYVIGNSIDQNIKEKSPIRRFFLFALSVSKG